MFLLHSCLGILLCVAGTYALYSPSDDVIDLTSSNFDKLVTNSDEIWLVEFYAPWCGHCKNLAPEYKKAATALKGIVKVGALDSDKHKGFASKYGVKGFPSIKIFTGGKDTAYQGQRTAEDIVEAVLRAVKDKVYKGLGKGTGRSSDKGHKIPWKPTARPKSTVFAKQQLTRIKNFEATGKKYPRLPTAIPAYSSKFLGSQANTRNSQNNALYYQAKSQKFYPNAYPPRTLVPAVQSQKFYPRTYPARTFYDNTQLKGGQNKKFNYLQSQLFRSSPQHYRRETNRKC